MDHEIKIIMKYNTEDIEHDQCTPLRGVRFFIDNRQVGCIWKLELSAKSDEYFSHLKVSFPKLSPEGRYGQISKEILDNVEKLKQIPLVEVELVDLNKEQ